VTALRAATLDDAEQIALLHADSWRRHYRGAFADSFLDGDVVADRRTVWSSRLASPAGSATIVAEDDAGLVGFVHAMLDEDDQWGSLIDNLHVVYGRKRGGVGTALLIHAAAAITAQAKRGAMYLWVLEQNTAAQGFYHALGGNLVERDVVESPGGVPGRLNGSPNKLRFAWPDTSVLSSS
jgi:ribosomal protein S18 acetylase RimI-like enzyme